MRPPLAISDGDMVRMRKPHACGANQWVVTQTGMDIRVRCTGCGRTVLMPRSDFERAAKKLERGGLDQSDP
ncbi:MAG: DUF951 domain-containing protein [Armatimonadota bacterium]